jgi:hypothetical protein
MSKIIIVNPGYLSSLFDNYINDVNKRLHLPDSVTKDHGKQSVSSVRFIHLLQRAFDDFKEHKNDHLNMAPKFKNFWIKFMHQILENNYGATIKMDRERYAESKLKRYNDTLLWELFSTYPISKNDIDPNGDNRKLLDVNFDVCLIKMNDYLNRCLNYTTYDKDSSLFTFVKKLQKDLESMITNPVQKIEDKDKSSKTPSYASVTIKSINKSKTVNKTTDTKDKISDTKDKISDTKDKISDTKDKISDKSDKESNSSDKESVSIDNIDGKESKSGKRFINQSKNNSSEKDISVNNTNLDPINIEILSNIFGEHYYQKYKSIIDPSKITYDTLKAIIKGTPMYVMFLGNNVITPGDAITIHYNITQYFKPKYSDEENNILTTSELTKIFKDYYHKYKKEIDAAALTMYTIRIIGFNTNNYITTIDNNISFNDAIGMHQCIMKYLDGN